MDVVSTAKVDHQTLIKHEIDLIDSEVIKEEVPIAVEPYKNDRQKMIKQEIDSNDDSTVQKL